MSKHLYKIETIKIDYDNNGDVADVTFYFEGSTEPFGVSEFRSGTPTRRALNMIESSIEASLAFLKKEQEPFLKEEEEREKQREEDDSNR